MRRFLFFSVLYFSSFCLKPAFGQSVQTDTAFITAATKSIKKLYQESVDVALPLYNGPEYVNPDLFYIEGHPFFKSERETEGDIVYDKTTYLQVPLLYDIVSDQVVIFHPASALYFKLLPEKVTAFAVANHTFIRLLSDTIQGASMRSGFYDLLVSGKTQVLAKRIKTTDVKPTQSGMVGSFLVANRFYIRKNKKYHQVKSKNSVLALFPQHKKELQKYVRSNQLNFKKDREKSIIRLVQFYSTLPGSS